MIIEWNAHMFSRDLARYPFHAQATYTPSADDLSDDPLADYLQQLEKEGIDRAVLVHPEPYGDDHRLVLDCLKREPNRLRATCLFYPKDLAAPQKLIELVRHEPRIVALRMHAHRGKEFYLDSFQDAAVRTLWETAGQLGLIIELHIGPNYAAQAGKIIRDYPTFPVLIDHLGEPTMGNAVEYADMLALAHLDNVYMKLSGVDYFAKDGPLYLSARPLTRWVVDAFGAARLVWGGVTPAIVDAHLAHLSASDRDRVKGGNLAQLLHFDA
ncbi:amidohydrolase family protein [soil metagenome]